MRSSWTCFLFLVPPTLTITPANVTTSQLSRVTFHCSASGDPLPVVSWYYSGSLLTNGLKYAVFSGSLTVKSVVVADAGWYTCRVSNIAGMKESTAYLNVQGKIMVWHFLIFNFGLMVWPFAKASEPARTHQDEIMLVYPRYVSGYLLVNNQYINKPRGLLHYQMYNGVVLSFEKPIHLKKSFNKFVYVHVSCYNCMCSFTCLIFRTKGNDF